MMKMILKKLSDRGGASIILALLFFLICVMVGASVLAAASSNAGKASKRREEQQEYFTVSSALQLVCDRLEKVEYRPNASVTAILVQKQPAPSSPWYAYTKTTYQQTPGTVTFDTDSTVNGQWQTLLPQLQKELDYLFAERFTEVECYGYHGEGKFHDDNMHSHSTLGGTDVSKPTEHILKIKVDDSGGVPDDALDELTKEVEVKIRLGKPDAVEDERYWLFVEAKSRPDAAAIKAELKLTGSFPHINYPETYNGSYPDFDQPPDDPKVSFANYPNISRTDIAVLKWELVRIYK